MWKVFAFLYLVFVYHVNSHGLLQEPPNRSTLWRMLDDPAIAPYKDIVEPNYDDNQLYCGGFQHQQSVGGKCGICGDSWDGVRENEAGGKYGKGIIVRQYPQGAIMEVTVELTAHHLGFFEFRLCEWNNPTVPATHECLNQNILQFQDGSTQYFPEKKGSTPWMFYMNVQLPHHITCSQCVLQWRYHAGNTWNCDENKECCTGCGPQEEFYGCADIAIGTGPTNPPPGWNGPEPTDPLKSTTTELSTTLPTSTTIQDHQVISTTVEAPTTPPSSNKPPVTTTTKDHQTTSTMAVSSTTTTSSKIPPDSKPSCENKPPGEYKADCESFYTCGDNDNGQEPFIQACPAGTYYDESREICDHDYNVPPPCGTKE